MVDVLVFGPHPDDIEICAGGLVLALCERGYSVGGVDMTQGESGTRGRGVARLAESQRGAQLLGLSFRECLDLPDGSVQVDLVARDRIITLVRQHRPQLLVAPWVSDDHPDHARTGQLVKDARFLAGCARVGPAGAPWRPGRVLFYPSREPIQPTLVVDVSAVFARKLLAIRAHASQLHDDRSTEQLTTIAAPEFLDTVIASNRHFGTMIGVEYGEPYLVEGPLAVEDPLPLMRSRGRHLFGNSS